MNGVKAVDVAGGVIDGIIEFDGIRSAVRQREERIAGHISDARTEASEKIGGSAILERIGEAGDVGQRSIAGLVESANGKKRKSLGKGVPYGENNTAERDQGDSDGFLLHGGKDLLELNAHEEK